MDSEVLRPSWVGKEAATIAVSAKLRIASYNVLLPNSSDGWWVYKYYTPLRSSSTAKSATAEPSTSSSSKMSLKVNPHSLWAARSKLLQQQIECFIQADVLCLQAWPESATGGGREEKKSEEDSEHTEPKKNALYVCHRKGRMRPVTVWNTSRIKLIGAPLHKDRCLVTSFLCLNGPPNSIIHVVNCHLTAGPDEARRVRQVHEAVTSVKKAIDKEARLQQQKASKGGKKARRAESGNTVQEVPELNHTIIVCGDFNSDGGHAIEYLLNEDTADSNANEVKGKSGKKKRKNPFNPFMDAYKGCEQPTLFAPPLIDVLCSQTHPLGMSKLCLDALTGIFKSLATDQVMQGDQQAPVMRQEAVDAYVEAINGTNSRGSEFRAAVALMQARATALKEARGGPGVEEEEETVGDTEAGGSLCLTLQDFLTIYARELREGKYWGVRHDLGTLGSGGEVEAAIEAAALEGRAFQGRFDRCMLSRSDAKCPTISATLASAMQPAPKGFLPNANHPSDHLPIGVELSWHA